MTAFNELRHGQADSPYVSIDSWLHDSDPAEFRTARERANKRFINRGITFAVYGDESGGERLIPFDVIPRILHSAEWTKLKRGCVQRVNALNHFLNDVYHDREIVQAGKIPATAIELNSEYCPQMQGVDVPGGVYSHISGVDLVRTGPEDWHVLEDNLRVPSGVSYMLENRAVMRRVLPKFFRKAGIAPVDHYPDLLLQSLRECAQPGVDDPIVVILTPGAGNSAYFEHAFLAQVMGIRLVEGIDLFTDHDGVWMHTTRGPERVDVIYRRINDDFLDPTVFRPESMLGVAGLFEAYRRGQVTIANAIGNGVADDKAMYSYVPDMIRFYLGEEPILDNVTTYRCSEADDLKYVLEHLPELVVKEVHGAGGYGMLVGPTSTRDEIETFRNKLETHPEEFIAQPTLALSTCPTFVESGVAPRHVDLRPYVLAGKEVRLVPGGLSRVALKEGSLVVNSSQGGGTKDTWVLYEGEEEGLAC